MGYNKRQFVKKNDKKALHKVRKHWVIVSMAFLGMIGATGLAKENVHASNLNVNHQTNDTINSNSVHNAQSTLVHGTNDQTVTAQSSRQSQKPAQVNSIRQFNQDQMTKRTDALRDRILMNQAQTAPKQFHIGQGRVASVTAKQSGQAAPQSVSVSGSSNLTSAAPSASQTTQTKMKLTKTSEPEVGDGENATDAVNNALNDIQTKYGQVGTLTTQALGYIAQAKSASNIANAQLYRYSDINPQSVNSSSSNPNYGSTADFAFNDNSESASNYDNKLNIDLENMPSAGALQDSVEANFSSSMADSLSDQILDASDNQKYEGSMVSLANQVDMDYDQAQELIGSMSSMASDANIQARKVSDAFSSVSAAADSAGNALYNNGTPEWGDNTLTSYPIANVSNATELDNALWDSNVTQINLKKNVSLWGLAGGDDNYYDIPSRNLNVNGLKKDGTWHTADFGDYNYDMNGSNPAGFPMVEVSLENLNLYGADYWGPVSVNHGSVNAIMRYNNLNYVGSQLAYNEADTRGIFEGHININAGAAYSPTGLYTKYSYSVPGNLSPYPGIIKNGIDTTDGSHIKPSQDVYTDKTKIDSKTGVPDIIHGTGIGGYVGFSTLTGQTGFGEQQTPDLAIPWSYNYAFHNDTTNNMQVVRNDGINTPSDQQILQINNNLSAVFKSNCVFNGSTTSSDGIAIDSNGYVYLEPGAKVHLTPRGYSSESTASGNDNTLPSGIDIGGTGNVDIGPGATLKITPMTDTNRFMPSGARLSAEGGSVSNCEDYAPAAINVRNGGNITINSGGILNIKYPDQYNYSLPDGNLNNGYEPKGAVYMGGTSSIHAHPYSTLIVNGGGPSSKSGNQGNLVYFETGGSGVDSNVDAQPHSNIQLSSAGDQKVALFYDPSGAYIGVQDPQQFSLDLTKNTNPNSQLANAGVSIRGDQVTGYDQPEQDSSDPDYDKFDHSFGQYNTLILPGQRYQLPKYLMQEIKSTINEINNYMSSPDKNTDPKSRNKWINQIWPNLSPVVWNDIVGVLQQSTSDNNSDEQHIGSYNGDSSTPDAYDVLNLINKAHLIPFGVSSLKNADNSRGIYEFNHSIDLPFIIAKSMMQFIEGNDSSAHELSQNLGQDPTQFGQNIANSLNTTIDGPDYYNTQNDTNMTYDALNIPIHQGGFNLTKGFAFKGVPQAYVEGVKIQNGVISGYAQPGSYIKLQVANHNQSNLDQDYDNDETTGQTDANVTPLTNLISNLKTINDHNYDYDDDPANQNKNGYVTTANAMGSVPSIGYWSYKLPSGLTQDEINNLVVTAHTATVGNKNSAREASYYVNGRNITLGKFGSNTAPAGQQLTQPANTHNVAPTGAHYAAYLSSDGKTLTVTGNFDNYGGNGVAGNNNAILNNVNTLNLGNAWNITNANKMFRNMGQLYTINQIGDWNTNDMQTAIGTFDRDDRMNAQYLGPIVSAWGNSSLTNNDMGSDDNGNNDDDPQYNGLISDVDKSKGQTTDTINFIYNGKNVGSTSIPGYLGATYNIDASKLPNNYTLGNAVGVTLSGHQHYVNVVKIDSPIYVGDTVSGAEAYYQNQDYFPNSPDKTYPTAGNEDPSGHQDDPTDTDDDDAGNYSQTGTDSNGNPIYTLTPYKDPDRRSYNIDDTDAGRYFQAGRLKGDLDRDNLTTDNSIYVMPMPFIIGYLTAQSTRMSPKQLIANINKIIRHVTHIKGRVDGTYGHPHLPSPMNSISYYDYKPKIWSDQSSADVSMADLSATMDSLGILLEATSPNPSHPYDPYDNLSSVANTLQSSVSNANYCDSLVHDQYSDVSQIDNRLSGILQTLDGYRNNLVNNGQEFNKYQDSAKSAIRNHQDNIKQMNILEMNIVANEDTGILSNANDQDSSAVTDESSASNDNTSASSNSNSMAPYYKDVRGSASNDEGDDFSSVAQSYTSNATSDSSNIVRYSEEISHRDKQINVADGVYQQAEQQLDYVTNSLENYVTLLSSLNDLHVTNNASLSTEYSADYNMASSALNTLGSMDNAAESYKNSDINNSYSANSDSSEATLAYNGGNTDSDTLSGNNRNANLNQSIESNFASQASSASAKTIRDDYNDAQVFNSLIVSNLNSGTDSQVNGYNGSAASAWNNIHDSLHDKISHDVGAIRGELTTLAPQLETYKAVITSANKMNNQPSSSNSSSSSSASNSSSASSSSSASAGQNYSGTYQVTVQDENHQGQPTSRDVETVPINAPVGSIITINPVAYQPIGFHAVSGDRPVGVQVTSQGVKPGNVTLYYMVDHEASSSNSNNNSSSASNSASSSNRASASSSASHQPNNPVQPSSSNQMPSSGSNNSNSAQPGSSNSNHSSSSANQNHPASSSNGQPFSLPSSSAGSSSSITPSSNAPASSRSASMNSSSANPIQNRIHSNSSSAESSASADSDDDPDDSDETDGTGDSDSQPDDTAGSTSSDPQSSRGQYTQGVNDARLGNVSASNDPSYQSGYQNYEQGSQQLPQTGDDSTVSLVAAMLIAASGAMMGFLADRRRHDE